MLYDEPLHVTFDAFEHCKHVNAFLICYKRDNVRHLQNAK
jgi:hypothetical protein